MNRLSRWLVNRRNLARSARVLDRVAPFLGLTTADRVLEVGTGAGGLSAQLTDRYHPRQVVATDFDPAQVEAARRAILGRYGSLPPGLELRTADALHLPFEDAAFDVVFGIDVFHHVEARHTDFLRRPDAAREVRRVLRPGGRLVYAEITRRAEFRECLRTLGFTPVYERYRWGHDLAVLRAPTGTHPVSVIGNRPGASERR